MKTDKLIVTENWEEIHKADKLGLDLPKRKTRLTKLLFWKKDIKKAFIDDDNNIMLEFYGESTHEIEYDEKIWKEIEDYFIDKEE